MGQSSAARVILQLLLASGASRPRAGGSLSFDSASLPRSKWSRPESFCLAAVSDAATKKSTNRPLAVVEAREELHTQRRADGHERAAAAGSADVIVDITSTGSTLRANHLKILDDGVILKSQACLVTGKRVLAGPDAALAREIAGRIAASLARA